MSWRKRKGAPQPDELAARLKGERAAAAALRGDAVARERARVRHRLERAGVVETARAVRRARRQVAAGVRADRRLGALYRQAREAGERARLRAHIYQSAEMRTLRVARLRTVALAVLIPVLLAFGAWSTAGVHHGVVVVLGLAPGSAGWWAAWLVEPALITVVAGIIIIRAVLRSVGGALDDKAAWVEWTALGLSLALNMVGAATGLVAEAHASLAALVVAVAGGVIAHSIGPAGAAGTAFLIGVIDDSITAADPAAGAPPLVEMAIPEQAGPEQTVAALMAALAEDADGAEGAAHSGGVSAQADGGERPVDAGERGERSVSDQELVDHAERVRQILADHHQVEIQQLAERGTEALVQWLAEWSAEDGGAGGTAVLPPPPADPPAIEQGDGEGERSGERPEMPLSAAERRAAIARELAADPTLTGPQIAERTGIPESTVRRLRAQVLGELSAHDERRDRGERQ